jgi:hypothetical protein
MAGNIGNAYMTSAANTGNAAMAAAGQRTSAFGGGPMCWAGCMETKGFQTRLMVVVVVDSTILVLVTIKPIKF